MVEGWHNKDYLMLYDSRDEAVRYSESYGVAGYLPGVILLGLKSWDDFIIKNADNQVFTVPTVPLDKSFLRPFILNSSASELQADGQFGGKIKWYVKPLIFGGDPSDPTNTAWISMNEHIEAVKWWNNLYLQVKQQKPNT